MLSCFFGSSQTQSFLFTECTYFLPPFLVLSSRRIHTHGTRTHRNKLILIFDRGAIMGCASKIFNYLSIMVVLQLPGEVFLRQSKVCDIIHTYIKCLFDFVFHHSCVLKLICRCHYGCSSGGEILPASN